MAAFHFHRRKTRRWWYSGATLVVASFLAVMFVVSAGATIGSSKFEGNDGNLTVQGGAGFQDWDNAPQLSVGQDKPTGTQDNSFGQGAKEDNVNTTVVSGSIPNSKADLGRFAVAGEVIGGDTYMYIAWTRENQSGTVNFDFELNQKAQPDLTTPGAKTLVRTSGDSLINYAFSGGSNTPTLTKYHWNGSNWVSDGAIAGTCSEGATNSQTISENLGGLTPVSRPAQQFGEASINLTCAGIVSSQSCEPFASIYVKSRSSTSFTSEIKDFIAPIPLTFSNCGKLTIIKHTDPGGLDQNFGYHTTGGLIASPGTFSLNDAGTDTRVFDKLQAGTYTVTEDANPFGFALESVTCTGAGGTADFANRKATAVVTGGSDITCTFVNQQQLGAIEVLKESTKTGNPPLAGATFSVTGPNSYSATLTTGADGTDCVDGLPFGTYHVTETGAPDGYDIDDTTTHDVAVNTTTDCSGSPQGVGGAFLDTPLTDISVNAHAQTADATASKITCSGTSTDGDTTASGTSGSSFTDPADASDTGLHPGTYTCTIVIDP